MTGVEGWRNVDGVPVYWEYFTSLCLSQTSSSEHLTEDIYFLSGQFFEEVREESYRL